MLYFLSICLLIYIPHTSIQDISVPIDEHHTLKRTLTTTNAQPIGKLLQWLTEQQYYYETAYYALALNNVFPNFAKLFHERSESKWVVWWNYEEKKTRRVFLFDRYDDVKGLIRLCQVLNLNVDLQFIASSFVSRPLRFLSPDSLNKTNFAQLFDDLQLYECGRTFEKLSDVYQDLTNISAPLQMYLREKFYTKQSVLCKLTSDLVAQLARFIDRESIDRSIPFSLMFFDSRMDIMITK